MKPVPFEDFLTDLRADWGPNGGGPAVGYLLLALRMREAEWEAWTNEPLVKKLLAEVEHLRAGLHRIALLPCTCESGGDQATCASSIAFDTLRKP